MHMACHLILREMPSMTDQASIPTVEASGVAKKISWSMLEKLFEKKDMLGK